METFDWPKSKPCGALHPVRRLGLFVRKQFCRNPGFHSIHVESRDLIVGVSGTVHLLEPIIYALCVQCDPGGMLRMLTMGWIGQKLSARLFCVLLLPTKLKHS